MHWFDGFVKSIAGEKTPRRAAIAAIGLGAGAASLPWARGDGAEAATVRKHPRRVAGPHMLHNGTPSKSHPSSRARRGAVRELLHVPASFHSGKCTFGHQGPVTSFGYKAATTSSGATVKLTVRHQTSMSEAGHVLTASQKDELEVTSDGALVVRVEALHHADNQSGSQHSGSVTFTYGAAVHGATGAKFTFEGSSISGSITRGQRSAKPRGTRDKTLTAQFVKDVAPVALTIDRNLHATIGKLFDRFASERQTCSTKPHRLRRASRHAPAWVSDRASFLRARGGRRELVQENGQAGGEAGVELQNSYGAPSTPNCTSCMNAAANQMAGCWESVGLDLLFGCAPCLIAQIQCQAEATVAALGCWIPGAGCMQTICGVGTSCDSEDTCCGSDCCTGSEVCLHGKSVCCPAGYTESCVSSSGGFPFCCQTGDVCCGIDLCCPEGSVCCGHDCCPAGSTCCGNACCYGDSVCVDPAAAMCCSKGETNCNGYCCPSTSMCVNGQCCTRFCGDECCPYGYCQNGKCMSYTFGTPSPKPAPQPSHKLGVSQCTPKFYLCTSQAKDGTNDDVCCPDGLQCCGSQCCGVGETCGGPGAQWACGQWIK